ncbi:unnamed protein product [Prorocentrum cordatum]|uniref:Uncharacterized protein n=1 Tax=Prorocentrum cordatum TaxID=2364126 RepID=A0ABN9WU48_9DINO|nr:unnamed protein product [Polarella glacialis]
MPENPFNRVMAKPADLRRSLDSVAVPALSEFAQWRAAEIAKELPDPVPDNPGAALFVVGAAEGGVRWNPLWLNLCGLAVSADGQTHWQQQPGGKQRYYNALERATLQLFDTTYEERTWPPSRPVACRPTAGWPGRSSWGRRTGWCCTRSAPCSSSCSARTPRRSSDARRVPSRLRHARPGPPASEQGAAGHGSG